MVSTPTRIEEQVAQLQMEIDQLKANAPEDKLSMVVFSGDLDRILAAFIIATGGAAMFEKVVMFFTFWAAAALRSPKKKVKGKKIMEKMFGMMLPNGSEKLTLSKMNMMGMGTNMMKGIMKQKGVLSLEDMIKRAGEYNVHIYLCEMSLGLMGFRVEEMVDYPNLTVCGVAKFLEEAGSSKTTLFI